MKHFKSSKFLVFFLTFIALGGAIFLNSGKHVSTTSRANLRDLISAVPLLSKQLQHSTVAAQEPHPGESAIAIQKPQVEGTPLAQEVDLLSQLSTRAMSSSHELDRLTKIWSHQLSSDDLQQLEQIAVSHDQSADRRLMAVYVLGDSGKAQAEASLLKVLNDLPLRVEDTVAGKNKALNFQLHSLAIDSLAKVGGEAALRELSERRASLSSPTLRAQAQMTLNAVLEGDRAYPERQQLALVRKLISRLRNPSQSNPVRDGFDKIRDQADVADMGTALRETFESEMGIDYSTFNQDRDNLDPRADSRRFNNALAFLKFIEFSEVPKGLVQGNYYDFMKGRVNEVVRSSGRDNPNVLAQAFSFTNATVNRFDRSKMEVFDAGINRGLFELTGTLVHEARHIQGFRHFDCDHDSRTNACDPNFAFGGSWAVAAEYASRVALFSKNTSQFLKTVARLYAVDLALEDFNTPALASQNALIVQTSNSFFLATPQSLRELPLKPSSKSLYLATLTGMVETGLPNSDLKQPRLLDALVGNVLSAQDGFVFEKLGQLGFMTSSDLKDLSSGDASENIFSDAIASDDLMHQGDLVRAICKRSGICVFNIQSRSKAFRGNWSVNFGSLPIRSVRIKVDESNSALDRFIGEVQADGMGNSHFRVANLFTNEGDGIAIDETDGPGELAESRRVYFGSARFLLSKSKARLEQESAGNEKSESLKALMSRLESVQGKIVEIHEGEIWDLPSLLK